MWQLHCGLVQLYNCYSIKNQNNFKMREVKQMQICGSILGSVCCETESRSVFLPKKTDSRRKEACYRTTADAPRRGFVLWCQNVQHRWKSNWLFNVFCGNNKQNHTPTSSWNGVPLFTCCSTLQYLHKQQVYNNLPAEGAWNREEKVKYTNPKIISICSKQSNFNLRWTSCHKIEGLYKGKHYVA